MQKVIVQADWYTRIISTLIAVLLVGIFVKSYFPLYIPETRASTAASQSMIPKGIRAAALNEGSAELAEYLYLYLLQDLPQEVALKIIGESPMLSGYRVGKAYANCLVVSERSKAYRILSDEAIKTVLRSGRFVVTPYGIVKDR